MARTHSAGRPSAGARRADYGLAILCSTALLIVLNGSPGWQAIPFLTSDISQVLWLVNLSLAAGIAANVVYLAYDAPWLRSLGELATTGIGLVTAIRIWQVFPLVLSSSWSTAVWVLLAVGIAGSCIALVAQIVSLARWLTDRGPRGGHIRSGHLISRRLDCGPGRPGRQSGRRQPWRRKSCCWWMRAPRPRWWYKADTGAAAVISAGDAVKADRGGVTVLLFCAHQVRGVGSEGSPGGRGQPTSTPPATARSRRRQSQRNSSRALSAVPRIDAATGAEGQVAGHRGQLLTQC